MDFYWHSDSEKVNPSQKKWCSIRKSLSYSLKKWILHWKSGALGLIELHLGYSGDCTYVDIYDSLFLNIYSTYDGGSIYIWNKNIHFNFHRSLISNSTSTGYYGGVYARIQDSFVSRTCLVMCTATSQHHSLYLVNVGEVNYFCNYNDSTVVLCPPQISETYYFIYIYGNIQTIVSDNISECSISSSNGFYDNIQGQSAPFFGVTVANNIGNYILDLFSSAATFSQWNLFNNSAPSTSTSYLIYNQDNKRTFTECVFLKNTHTNLYTEQAVNVSQSFICSNNFTTQPSVCTETLPLNSLNTFLCEIPPTQHPTRLIKLIIVRIRVIISISAFYVCSFV
jgi:hypothetical protein